MNICKLFIYWQRKIGGVVEWFNATVLKTVVRDERTEGSNPSASAT